MMTVVVSGLLRVLGFAWELLPVLVVVVTLLGTPADNGPVSCCRYLDGASLLLLSSFPFLFLFQLPTVQVRFVLLILLRVGI